MRQQEVQQAVCYGAAAIGLVFVPASIRNVSMHTAKALCSVCPASMPLIAVFMNQKKNVIQRIVDSLPISMLQFHGRETHSFCSSFSLPYIKSVAMSDIGWRGLLEYTKHYPSASGFLLDSNRHNEMGGRGKSFSWQSAPLAIRHRTILSGGLCAETISDAQKKTKLDHFDVSSGIESKPGVKDINKIKLLLTSHLITSQGAAS